MEVPCVFVSSALTSPTDRQCRESAKRAIEDVGYRCIAPRPIGGTVTDTSLGAVSDAHIFLLILTGSVGKTRPNDEWIVVSEYDAARRCSLTIMIFEHRSLRVVAEAPGRKDEFPSIDPECIAFRDRVSGDKNDPIWITSFEDQIDLQEKIRQVFAAKFAQLLELHTSTNLTRRELHMQTMTSYYIDRKWVQALLWAEKILRSDPNNIEALLTRANCKARINGISDTTVIREGLRDCQKALEIDPSMLRARYNLANFMLFSPTHDTSEVQKELDILFEEFPEYESYFQSDGEFSPLLALKKQWEKSWRDSVPSNDIGLHIDQGTREP